MASNWTWLLGAVFVASSAFFLAIHKGRRETVLDRLSISRRRVSGAKTPPRSLSPSKKQVQALVEANYLDTFPPSRRHALAELQQRGDLERFTESPTDWSKNMLPMMQSYREAEDSMFTPCGFSVEEIKALGDFPDYSILSGVPLPSPYPEFDINKALPRPYRPFRWAYHQTMCK
jgi:hypothetical protein